MEIHVDVTTTRYVLGHILKKYVLVNIKKLEINIHINNKILNFMIL